MCSTVEQLHPFQSTRDLDGSYSDRETVQDIAFDGETFGRKAHICLPTKNSKMANGRKLLMA
jgi:hypothetical protein